MRKVRHKNVVQFIGACTIPPNLCIITEYMSGGSVYDYLRKQKALLKMPMLLRVAIDVSKGMDYLHQNKIIHRDLKAANLLLDENEVQKCFSVTRSSIQDKTMLTLEGSRALFCTFLIENGTVSDSGFLSDLFVTYKFRGKSGDKRSVECMLQS